MTTNYHTHTFRCNHASGTEREFIEKAIESGFKEFGFSDHTPYPFSDNHDSNFRMKLEQADDYFTTIAKLKKEYEKDIKIHIGVEAEYYPRDWKSFLRFMENYPLEYMIMGQHYVGNEGEESSFYSGNETKNPDDLKKYVNQVLEGLSTGKFIYLAHPDLLKFTGSDEVFDKEFRRLCEGVKKLDLPLEINILGLHTNRHYPSEKFWKIASEVGNKAIIGCDAHTVDGIYQKETIEKAKQLVAKFNLPLVEKLNIKDKI